MRSKSWTSLVLLGGAWLVVVAVGIQLLSVDMDIARLFSSIGPDSHHRAWWATVGACFIVGLSFLVVGFYSRLAAITRSTGVIVLLVGLAMAIGLVVFGTAIALPATILVAFALLLVFRTDEG